MKMVVTIPASATATIDAHARYVYLKDTNVRGGRVRFQGSASTFDVDEEMKKGSRISQLSETIYFWTVTNLEVVAQTITINTGMYFYDEDSSESEVITRDAERSLDENLYVHNVGVPSTNYLLNPAGSGLNILIEKLFYKTVSAVVTDEFLGFARVVSIAGGVDITGIANKHYKMRSSQSDSPLQTWNNPAPGVTNYAMGVNANMHNKFNVHDMSDRPIILAPGEAINLTGSMGSQLTLDMFYKTKAI